MQKKIDSINISVIIPMYNSMDTIIDTLESIKNQTEFNQIFEIIIINDGSTDKSLDLVKKYKNDNIHMPIIIIDKVNGGVSSARNTGMIKSKGNWIALLDSDDKWLPNKLEVQIKTINENPNIDFLGGDINEKGVKILWKKINKLYKADVRDICLKTFPQTSTAIFRREIFEEIGGYDEKQRYVEDANYFLKICSLYNYYYLPGVVVNYGDGKREFGDSGLSSNLKEMHRGNVKNIKELKRDSIISTKFYLFLRIFYFLKYLRRILITKMT